MTGLMRPCLLHSRGSNHPILSHWRQSKDSKLFFWLLPSGAALVDQLFPSYCDFCIFTCQTRNLEIFSSVFPFFFLPATLICSRGLQLYFLSFRFTGKKPSCSLGLLLGSECTILASSDERWSVVVKTFAAQRRWW